MSKITTNRYDDDEDNFEEDGCTFEFGDETEGGAGSSGVAGGAMYRVYEGEDFGQYLDDDSHVMSSGSQLDGGGGGDGADNSHRRKSTALLRETFGRLLSTVSGGGPGGGRSKHSPSTAAQPQNPGYRIQEVSFADCKMGSVLVDTRSGAGHGADGSDSGIDSRSGYSLETESDLGPSRSSVAAWWDMNKLSSRSQKPSSASALELRNPPPSSFSSSSGKRVLSKGPALDASGVNDDNIGRSQQQQQRQQQYQKSFDTDKALSDGVKRLSNPFRKIYKTLNRRKSTNLPEMSYNQDYEDIRL